MAAVCLFVLRACVLVAVLAAGFPAVQADTETSAAEPIVVFLVRHSEKAEGGEHSGDPPLSRTGERRARELARVLSPAGVNHVHSTDFRRTRDTARPLADTLELEIRAYDPRELSVLADRLRAAPGRHLVVGHSNTTAELVELLGGESGAPIDEAREYDRLYTVVLAPGAAPVTVLQRYGKAVR